MASLTTTMRPQVSPLVLSDYRFGQRLAVPVWSKAAILVLLSCLLIPRGVELQLGTIMIDSSRVALAVFSLMAFNKLLSGSIILHLTAADLFIFAHVGIVAVSAVYHEGFGEGLESAIAVLVDMGLAYFVARAAIRNLQCYRYCVRVVLVIAAVSAVFGVAEMFTGHSIVRAAYQAFFPKVGQVYLRTQRLGLYRATATFRADILFGLYCMTAFALSVCMKPYQLAMRPRIYKLCLLLCVLGVFASLSSGPWIAFGLCLLCLAYGWVMKGIRGRWKLLLFAVGAWLMFLSIVSNRGPVKLVIDYLTLNPLSGYVRLGMWESVWAMMPEYWPLGWGWKSGWPRLEWYIWESIDSFYAVLFVRSGIFAVLSIVSFLVYSWYRLSSYVGRSGWAGEAKGWVLGTVCLFVTAITVDIFGNLVFATYFLLGAGQVLFTAYEPAPHYGRALKTVAAVESLGGRTVPI
jgi:hypothetical protein